MSICKTCNKETNELYLCNEVEMCKDCFETLVRVSQFKSLQDATDEERAVLLAYTRESIKSIFE